MASTPNARPSFVIPRAAPARQVNMAPLSKKILVIGATGSIGKILLNALINAKSNFDRIGILTSTETLATKKEQIESLKSRGVDILEGDVSNDNDVLEAYKGFDTVVSAVGRNAIETQVNLITLAEKSPNIVRFLPSEYGTDIEYNESSAGEKPHQKKLKVRAAMQSDAVRRLTYTYLVTGPWSDYYVAPMPREPQVGNFNVMAKEATLLGDGNGRISFTTMVDVGRLLVAVLKHPDVCDGKAIKVNSFTTTPLEILAEFERQTESKWAVKYTPLAELREREAKAWEQGYPMATGYTLKRIWTEGGTLYDKTDNEAIEMTKMDTLEMVVQASISSQVSASPSGKL